uniref:GAMM1 protein-like protein n=1 Tax=Nannochloris bacillaris TaxID=76111 RepID=Q68BK8_NANBA|nr:GAMM1 protein-like protein [Nannochloris bacillaris]
MSLDPTAPEVDVVYLTLYKNFMEAIDAIDNGVNQWDGDAPPKYLNNTHLSARVGNLNPSWNEDSSDATLAAGFQAAVALTGSEFSDALGYLAKSWLPARALVLADLQACKDIDPSGEIMKLNSYCPWKEHLHQLEKELGISGQVKYVLYEDEREKKWRIQAVGTAPGSFDSRKALPVPWRGLRDDDLSGVTGIPGGVFVHASGFIGGNATYEGALEMAKKALTMD